MSSAKRKRPDSVASTLTKPFRSPLKATNKNETEDQSSQKPSNIQQLQEAVERAGSSDGQAKPSHSIPPAVPKPQTHCGPLHLSPIRPAYRIRDQDPEHIALQKQYSALTVRLTRLNQSIDIVQQALKVAHSNQDTEIKSLIQKWRSTARDAAEELFSTAKDRVNRMGGVGAWREKTRTTSQNHTSWGSDYEINEEELNEEQKEALDIQREDARKEAEKYLLTEPIKPPDRDDDSFTMDMLLGQLNVELEIIGYDKTLQRWVDD